MVDKFKTVHVYLSNYQTLEAYVVRICEETGVSPAEAMLAEIETIDDYDYHHPVANVRVAKSQEEYERDVKEETVRMAQNAEVAQIKKSALSKLTREEAMTLGLIPKVNIDVKWGTFPKDLLNG